MSGQIHLTEPKLNNQLATRWQKLQEVGPKWGQWVAGGVTLKSVYCSWPFVLSLLPGQHEVSTFLPHTPQL